MKDDNGIELSRQFKVICSKDPKTKTSDYKIFMDCSGLIYKADKLPADRLKNIIKIMEELYEQDRTD